MADADEAIAVVVDDGVGDDPLGAGGSGLARLSERVTKVGGRPEAGPQPGGGFRLRVSVSIPSGTPPHSDVEALHPAI
jgi:signal transduction histidine kinase